jgi:hypothetical protein
LGHRSSVRSYDKSDRFLVPRAAQSRIAGLGGRLPRMTVGVLCSRI